MKDSEVTHHVVARIEQARKEANLSQQKLAEKIEKSSSSVLRWENEKSAPPLVAIVRIAEALDRPVAFFLQDVASDQKWAVEAGDLLPAPVVENGNTTELAIRLRDLVEKSPECNVYIELSGSRRR